MTQNQDTQINVSDSSENNEPLPLGWERRQSPTREFISWIILRIPPRGLIRDNRLGVPLMMQSTFLHLLDGGTAAGYLLDERSKRPGSTVLTL